MLKQLKKMMYGEEQTKPAPAVSFIVIVYNMSLQAENTLRSLRSDYQVGADEADYEVVVVENRSSSNMRPEFIESLPDNFSYHLRDETEPTPVHAINHGAKISRGDNICVMIDGARLVTPGVVKNIIMAHRLTHETVVTVPGYHIGEQLQQDAVENGYGVKEDQALIQSIAWPGDGYRLFDIACFSGSCAPGFFRPNSESNCISIPRDIWFALGGLDVRFNLRGGGLINLDLYKRACEYHSAQHVVLMGEGTFHQFHGGVTTGGEARELRAAFIEEIKQQYEDIRGEPYQSPDSNPVFLGELPRQVLRFIHLSAEPMLAQQPEASVAVHNARSAIR